MSLDNQIQLIQLLSLLGRFIITNFPRARARAVSIREAFATFFLFFSRYYLVLAAISPIPLRSIVIVTLDPNRDGRRNFLYIYFSPIRIRDDAYRWTESQKSKIIMIIILVVIITLSSLYSFPTLRTKTLEVDVCID